MNKIKYTDFNYYCQVGLQQVIYCLSQAGLLQLLYTTILLLRIYSI